MTRSVTNIAASVRERLLAEAKRRKIDFRLILQRYAAERFLYRIGASPHRERFVLKGAMLFVLWDEATARPTRDLDLAGYWANDAESLAQVVREICSMSHVRDGLEYLLAAMTLDPIRTADEYHRFRIQLDLLLAGARIPFQIDVGFGDAIVPGPVDVSYPTLLGGDAPNVRAYPREVVIAESFMPWARTASATAGTRTSSTCSSSARDTRLQEPSCSRRSGRRLHGARARDLEPWPVALTTAFYANATRSEQWMRYLQRTKLGTNAPAEFGLVGERVRTFLEPPLRAMKSGHAYTAEWLPGGPWQ